jgi:hypothetical protein
MALAFGVKSRGDDEAHRAAKRHCAEIGEGCGTAALVPARRIAVGFRALPDLMQKELLQEIHKVTADFC